MSLFVFQQKIPFQSVIRWLRYYEPGSETPPGTWAKNHADDIAPGDILFVWEPIYSPWGDSGSGIGVAEGDSFKVSQLFLVTKWEEQVPVGFCVSTDTYERQSVAEYLEDCAGNAKGNGVGYYYSIVRANPALSADKLGLLEGLDAYGPSGWRAEDASNPDIPYAFFQSAGYGVEARTGMVLDIAQLGFALFCDKDPPPGGSLPDIRRYTAPVYKDAHRDPSKGDGLPGPEVANPPPTAAESSSALPKIPSFFKNPLAGPSPFAAPAGGSPAPAPSWETQGGEPTPEGAIQQPAGIDRTEVESWAMQHDVETSDQPAEIAPSNRLHDVEADGDGSVPTEGVPAYQSADMEVPSIRHEDSVATEDVPAFQMPQDQMLMPPEAEVEEEDPTPPAVPTNIKAPRIVPPRPTGVPPVPAAPSRGVPPMPAAPKADATAPAPEPVAEATPEPALEAPAMTPAPSPAPVSAAGAAAKVDLKITTELDPSLPLYLQEQPKQPGVEDIMAAIETSIRETTELKKQEAKSEQAPAQRVRPGRTQPAKEEAKPEEQQQQGQPEQGEGDAGADLPPGPPKKKKQEVAESARAQEMQNRAQLKEPIAVKSGVAGLVSKLEQQASKASARLETQVEDIQGRLTEELNRLLGKVNGSERRSAKSAEGLRINLTGKMDQVANAVKQNVAEASAQGMEKVRTFDSSGCEQLDEKHEYLRTSLTGSFDEVRARAQTVSKSFEETLTAQSQEMLTSLTQMRTDLRVQFNELEKRYVDALQAYFDNYKERVEVVMQNATGVVADRHGVFDAQMADLRKRHLDALEHTKAALVSKLSKQFVVAETEMVKLQTSALEETLLPKLKQHREELRVVTTEFQHKLSQDLDEKGETKVDEFEPVLQDKKEKLLELLKETTTVKDSIQDQLRGRLEGIFSGLKEFVGQSIDQAQTAFEDTEEQLGEIDREIRGLADPSTIEGDLELLNERNEVLQRLDEITETSKENVLNTLRSSVAALEERGKSLQEELISSMEEDAYQVRRASEQALVQIREAIRDSFVAIQTAQDERMPM